MNGGVTLRTSTIFIATGGSTKIYRDLKDVPPKLRRKLVQSTSGANSATILIADRKGRQALARAVRGLPASATKAAVKMELAPRSEKYRHFLIPLRLWAELAVAGGLGLLIWLLATGR